MSKINVKTKKEFTISLDASPTTGYTWEARFDETMLQLKEKMFEPHSSAIGGGGIETFTFIPAREGETDIIMHYKRPWEEKVVEEKKFQIFITE
ncbi:MAG: protease inhibitor I42 family protein [Theionarchaea archaeon]|nr:MAG: hypothetical protein AYK18_00480 [Theionarchaea archaeon DG-70]MBU7012907.1 protease inhibitor I42 family protein [Theionarchaea archaeon]